MFALSSLPFTVHLQRTTVALVLLLPWLLVQFQAGSEIAIDVIAVCFVARCGIERRWAWLTEGWVPIGLAWWSWLVVCTLLNAGHEPLSAVPQSLAMVRFLVFAAALERWTLADAPVRTWFAQSLGMATLYVVAQTLLQFVTGHNLFGATRYIDGELTGPFDKPRAGPSYVRMLFPVLVPAGCAVMARRGWVGWTGALCVFAGPMAVAVLIGQRMPVLLAAMGLALMAALLPRLRGPVVVALAAAAALIAATVVVSPPTFHRLVTKFSQQMADWPDSHYGEITARALAITAQTPLIGRGYDGFEASCALPRYFVGWHWPGEPARGDGGGAGMCTTHPHSLYLQAMTDAGLPGLLLFCALVMAWLARLGRGLWRGGDPLRVGLFVAAFIQLFPIASTSPLISIPIGGWFFVLLGFGLAESADPRHDGLNR